MKINVNSKSIQFLFLAMLGICSLSFFSEDAIAGRCQNLEINVGFNRTEIDVTTLPLNSQLDLLTVNGSDGECNGDYDEPHERGGFVVVDAQISPVIAPRTQNPSSRLELPDEARRVGLLAFKTGKNEGLNKVKSHVMPFTLKEKWPGETIIKIEDVLGPGFSNHIYSAYNKYSWHNEKESATITVTSPVLKVIYKPTCSVSVNDIDFGTLTVDEILKGVSKSAIVNVNCNDILLNYDITISSDKGIASEPGVILSDNDTVGYHLTWGDLSQSGLPNDSNKDINLGASLTSLGSPASPQFNIPINVKPISRALQGNDIKPGESNSRINIKMKFN